MPCVGCTLCPDTLIRPRLQRISSPPAHLLLLAHLPARGEGPAAEREGGAARCRTLRDVWITRKRRRGVGGSVSADPKEREDPEGPDVQNRKSRLLPPCPSKTGPQGRLAPVLHTCCCADGICNITEVTTCGCLRKMTGFTHCRICSALGMHNVFPFVDIADAAKSQGLLQVEGGRKL